MFADPFYLLLSVQLGKAEGLWVERKNGKMFWQFWFFPLLMCNVPNDSGRCHGSREWSLPPFRLHREPHTRIGETEEFFEAEDQTCLFSWLFHSLQGSQLTAVDSLALIFQIEIKRDFQTLLYFLFVLRRNYVVGSLVRNFSSSSRG